MSGEHCESGEKVTCCKAFRHWLDGSDSVALDELWVWKFEDLAFSLPKFITAVLIYHPLKPHPAVVSELSELLTIASSLSSRLLLTGDFNIHIDQPNTPLTSDFLSLLDCFHLTQHTNFPTNTKGHILDIVCSASLPVSNPHPLPFPLSDYLCIILSAPLTP